MAVGCCATELFSHDSAVRFAQCKNAARRVGRLCAHFSNAAQEKFEPTLPIAVVTHSLQPVVVILTVPLEVV